MTQKTARFFLALAVACLVRAGHCQDAGTLRIEALDRSGLLARDPEAVLYLGADFNGWNPAGTAQSGWLDTDGARTGWVFRVPREAVGGGGEFKFTRGSWATVETGAGGAMLENRRTGRIDWDTPGGPVLRCEVLGFEDLAGGGDAEAGPTVVGGTLEVWELESEVLGEARTVRVWLPESYARDPERAFGVFYFHDGQNVFDARTSAFGFEWEADEAVTALVSEGAIGAWILVGIDNSGVNRSRDYLPYPPGERAPGVPGGGADAYVAFLVDELMPAVAERYRVLEGPGHAGIGGSSLGGVVTLHAIMTRPGVFGRALIESPSLWVGDGRLIRSIELHDQSWPERVYLGMGDAESGDEGDSRRLVELTHLTSGFLSMRGLGGDRLMTVIGAGQRHNERAWRERLPEALRFLLGGEEKEPEEL